MFPLMNTEAPDTLTLVTPTLSLATTVKVNLCWCTSCKLTVAKSILNEVIVGGRVSVLDTVARTIIIVITTVIGSSNSNSI